MNELYEINGVYCTSSEIKDVTLITADMAKICLHEMSKGIPADSHLPKSMDTR